MTSPLSVFRGSRVLITGHTGFKGSWLSAWMQQLGAQVSGVALDPPSLPAHFVVARIGDGMLDHRADIRDGEGLYRLIQGYRPNFLFHLAAQPLVRRAYSDPLKTYETNVIGTLNVLESLRRLDHPCVAVLITSDKCYDNKEWVWGYRESDSLGGSDPYSASKGAAELMIRSHVRSFFPTTTSLIRIGVARAGNVIGGGDWAADRIVPDCVRAWSEGRCVELRSPRSTRPWQHVLEPLSGYLTLAAELDRSSRLHGEPFNFGPADQRDRTVAELVQEMSQHWERVVWQDSSGSRAEPHESGLLKLNCDKALHRLNWRAVLDFETTVRLTTEWYRSFYEDPAGIAHVTRSQISSYAALHPVPMHLGIA